MHRRVALTLALAALLPGALRAQGWIQIDRPVRVGVPTSVVRVSSSVRTTIEGRVARVEVEERFRNDGAGLAEGSYLYPVPGEAAVTDFALWIGETQVHGEMMDAEHARGIYEDIVRRLRDPALLTFEGDGLLRGRVFPIPPGATRRVVLRYTQLLRRDGDALRLQYAIGPRPAAAPREDGQPAPPPPDTFRYVVEVPDAATYGTPYSPTQRITTRRAGDRLQIALDPDATGDVEIFLPLRRGLVGTSVVTSAPGGEDGYFMLLLAPPAAEEGEALPRDLTLVLDVSGSMAGDKLEQARSALRQAIAALRPADRFRLVAFSTRVVNFRDGYVAATPANLDAARAFLDGLDADGGTNIAGALEAVLGTQSQAERLSIVVFVTDGLPTVGERSPERIAALAGARAGRARIFPVGVGYDVNTYLLDRLAVEGRGVAEYVAPDADVETAMSAVLGRIQHPALVNLRIAAAPVALVETYPAALPDLFFGQELVVFGRYRGAGSGPVVVTGERNGHRERYTTVAAFPATAAGNTFIPRLWAARRIGDLTRRIRVEGATPDLIAEVKELGLRYGIVTEYTAYLVQEPQTAWNQPQPRALAPALQGGAGAATLQTGRDAFERAKASAVLGGVMSLESADRAAATRINQLAQATGSASRVRRAGGRLFSLTGGVWTDVLQRDSLKVVAVAPYSDAYFALVRALPEIVPCLGVGDRVLIAGHRASIEIGPAGATTWSAGALETLVRAFR
jgi:Ca-activated chloride channel family protein